MTTYESKTAVNQPKAKIFEQISDMRNLEKYKAAFPQQSVGEMTFAQDFITAEIPQFGQTTIRLTEKIEQKTLKFVLENLPVNANFYVNLYEIQPEKTQIQLTLEANIPFFVRPVIDEKLRTGINKAAELLAVALEK
jgi:hypothetical protein